MKSIHTIILSILIANFVAAQEKVNLKFNFYFANSNEGSIRKTKLVVKSDGVKIGESTVKDQDKYNSVEVNIPKGYHRITAVACAQNDGIWEERTLANNYSLDCIYEKSQNWNAGYIIDLRFDLKDMDVKADEEILFGDDMLDNLTNNNTASSTNTNSTTDYQTALKKLNDYLKTFDNGYYGYFEVKDGYIYDRFKAGKYNKFKMEDIEGAVIQEQYSRVIFKCKGGNKCISTDWKVNGTEDYTQFTQSSSYNYQELADLLNNFRDAYLGKKQPSTNNSTVSANKSREEKAKERQQPTSKTNDDDLDEDWDALEKAAAPLAQVLKESNKNTSSNYQPALKNLNEYLKTYNAETYKNVEVKDGKVYFGFFVYGANYKSSIDINELKNNTIITIGKSVGSSVVDEVKISCKGSSKCFYSTYSNGGADHFRFFSHSVKDFTKMEQLLKDFIKIKRNDLSLVYQIKNQFCYV